MSFHDEEWTFVILVLSHETNEIEKNDFFLFSVVIVWTPRQILRRYNNRIIFISSYSNLTCTISKKYNYLFAVTQNLIYYFDSNVFLILQRLNNVYERSVMGLVILDIIDTTCVLYLVLQTTSNNGKQRIHFILKL